jgi:hypothetical protein
MTAEQQQVERRKLARGIFVEDKVIEHCFWDGLGDDSWHVEVGLQRLRNRFTKDDGNKSRQVFFASVRQIARAGRCGIRTTRRYLQMFPRLGIAKIVSPGTGKEGKAPTWQVPDLTTELLDRALAIWEDLSEKEREVLSGEGGTYAGAQGVPLPQRKGSTPAATQEVPLLERNGTPAGAQGQSVLTPRTENADVKYNAEESSISPATTPPSAGDVGQDLANTFQCGHCQRWRRGDLLKFTDRGPICEDVLGCFTFQQRTVVRPR